MTTINWVYATSYSGWDISWAGFFGGLPKLTVVCGNCGRHSKSRATESTDRRVFVWCQHCGIANVARGLVVA